MDLAAGEGARGVAVDEQGEHHAGRILGGARAALVDARGGEVERGDGVHDEVDHVVGGHPVAQVGREEKRGVVVNVDEPGGHARSMVGPDGFVAVVSPTGC